MYDYLLVGAGLFNAVIANELKKQNKKCLVIEKRNHIGGNCYTKEMENINVHVYGAHIFRTSDKKIWDYMNGFVEFNNFINTPMAKYKDEIYNMPFNMNTFSRLWNISTPDEAKDIIRKQSIDVHKPARNLEEHAIGLVGIDIYEKLIKGYTEKQWGKECVDLPISIMRRIPIRLTYDNNYYDVLYQGVPKGGYTAIFEKMFEGCDVIFNTDYLEKKEQWNAKARRVVYTGAIDEYYNYIYGELEYRSLKFDMDIMDTDNYQGVAVVNYTDKNVPYTRIIEHKHFEFGKQKKTVISKEYPLKWKKGMEQYYPINNSYNNELYKKYNELAKKDSKIVFGGRLGMYQYLDMEDTIKKALEVWRNLNESD